MEGAKAYLKGLIASIAANFQKPTRQVEDQSLDVVVQYGDAPQANQLKAKRRINLTPLKNWIKETVLSIRAGIGTFGSWFAKKARSFGSWVREVVFGVWGGLGSKGSGFVNGVRDVPAAWKKIPLRLKQNLVWVLIAALIIANVYPIDIETIKEGVKTRSSNEYIVIANSLNVRECPEVSCERLYQLRKNDVVTVRSDAEVSSGCSKGWVDIGDGFTCSNWLLKIEKEN